MNEQKSLGKKSADWASALTECHQPMPACDPKVQARQGLDGEPPATGSWLSRQLTNCPNCAPALIFSPSFSCRRPPPYYVGEGVVTPSPVRKEVDPGSVHRHPQSKTAVLALDLGTSTGWAVRQRDGTITSGTQHFKPQRFEGGGMRFLRFKRWLSELYTASGELGTVYFEEVRRHTGVDAAHLYGGLMAHLTAWCEQHLLPYQGVPVGAIKRHVAGRGDAGKGEVATAVKERGYGPLDDNEADALALLLWAIETQEG